MVKRLTLIGEGKLSWDLPARCSVRGASEQSFGGEATALAHNQRMGHHKDIASTSNHGVSIREGPWLD